MSYKNAFTGWLPGIDFLPRFYPPGFPYLPYRVADGGETRRIEFNFL